MTAARLAAVLVAALAFAPSAHARTDAPRLEAPKGLRAFLLRADEPETHKYPRTPSFAWLPVPRTLRYEFQLSTSDLFRDNGIIYSNRDVKAPTLSVPMALPWITGKDGHSLYARVRAVTQVGKTPWTEYGFDVQWTTRPEPMSTFPGLLRWTPVPGATGYEVWFVDAKTDGWPKGKVIGATTNVADLREFYTFHTDLKWIGTVRWRIRAVRAVYGERANQLPAVSYGPWSTTYTAVNPPFAVGKTGLVSTVSDLITDATVSDKPHGLMPGFTWAGNTTMFDTNADLYRVYAFTDADCVNVVFKGSIIGSPAFAPRATGVLKLPSKPGASTSYLDDGPTSGVGEWTFDGFPVEPNETVKTAAESSGGSGGEGGEPTEGEPADADTPSEAGSAGGQDSLPSDEQAKEVPLVDLWDTRWPQGGYYWTVVGVGSVQAPPIETKLAASAVVGATTIALADATGLVEGNQLEVGAEVATIAAINGTTITLAKPLTAAHVAGETVKRSASTIDYRDAELAQDVCAAGRVMRFGKQSEPAVSIAGAPLVSGLSLTGKLISATRTEAVFYGPPVAAWNPAWGAHGYEVQWSKSDEPFEPAAKPILTYATSAALPLTPGTWYYRVRGLNLTLANGAQPLSWSDTVKVVVAKPHFKIVKK